jgi:hypothetical protein
MPKMQLEAFTLGYGGRERSLPLAAFFAVPAPADAVLVMVLLIVVRLVLTECWNVTDLGCAGSPG